MCDIHRARLLLRCNSHRISYAYYVVVWHRNHAAVMSAAATTLGATSLLYDFTSTGQAYTLGPAPMSDLGGGTFGLYGGDADADGQVTASDFNIWLVNTKAVATGYLPPDFNLDGQATASDFNLWLVNTKAVAESQVP